MRDVEINKRLGFNSTAALRYVSHSAILVAAVSSAASTIGYVIYKDYSRYRRMVDTFAAGNMLEPFTVRPARADIAKPCYCHQCLTFEFERASSIPLVMCTDVTFIFAAHQT